MNKKQLIAQLSGSLNLSKADAERTFDTITNTILEALKGDDSVKIAGFGTYKVAKRKARVGRNPRTGEQIQIAASQKVKFLPAKACLLYTSDAADDLTRVDLGGRRIIKKKPYKIRLFNYHNILYVK